MTLSSRFRRAAVVAPAAILMTAMQAAGAQAPANLTQVSTSGNFLAARHAGIERDAGAAAIYYQAALKGDPNNSELLGRAFLAMLANGDMDEAVRLADRVLRADKNDRIARLVLGVADIKKKQYIAARQQLAQSVRGPITDLAATLLSAWTQASAGESRAAIDSIDKLKGPDWYEIFKDMHAGMIMETAGQRKEAGRRLEHAYKLDATALRVVQSYGGWLSRQGNNEEALKVFKAFDEVLPHHPLITESTEAIEAKRKLPSLADTPQAGAAEVLYGLGAALGRRGGEDLGLIYLQLALYLAPQHPMALLSLADLYEAVKKPELAIKTYERVPASSPLHRNAQIQRALDLDGIDRTDEAKVDLQKLITARPNDLESIMALGNVQRGRKQFAECADTYSKGIATIGKPEKSNWIIFYFRGICYERSKEWPKAEADLKKALDLFPDQPHVLNYLGYSWIDQGVNLDEAVKTLERAVELKPEDPTINDHLGDAYWRIGRVLEARFQWSHARDLKPEPEDLVKIEEKIKSGLPNDASAPAADATEKAQKPDGG